MIRKPITTWRMHWMIWDMFEKRRSIGSHISDTTHKADGQHMRGGVLPRPSSGSNGSSTSYT
jgi:hypothetical protein